MGVAERVGVSRDFFTELDEFTAHPERYEASQFQRAAQAVDVALSETIKYMTDEAAGRRPPRNPEELSGLWQAASREVAPLD
jgi:hypothetical protein